MNKENLPSSYQTIFLELFASNYTGVHQFLEENGLPIDNCHEEFCTNVIYQDLIVENNRRNYFSLIDARITDYKNAFIKIKHSPKS